MRLFGFGGTGADVHAGTKMALRNHTRDKEARKAALDQAGAMRDGQS
jgi:hypothetical protein